MLSGRKCVTGRQISRHESLANAKVSVRQQCVYEGPYRKKSSKKTT